MNAGNALDTEINKVENFIKENEIKSTEVSNMIEAYRTFLLSFAYKENDKPVCCNEERYKAFSDYFRRFDLPFAESSFLRITCMLDVKKEKVTSLTANIVFKVVEKNELEDKCYYALISKDTGEICLAQFYAEPLDIKKPAFFFNVADGGGVVALEDLSKNTSIVRIFSSILFEALVNDTIQKGE